MFDKTLESVAKVFENGHASGDGVFTRYCSEWIKSRINVENVLMTTSGSHALDMAAYLCNIEPGDEVIMPSYTFPSTANAFLGQGAKIVFIDVRPDTMNMDEELIEAAITPKTKVVVPVDYAGVPCELDKINDIAKEHSLLVVEDAAQALMSTYRGKAVGSQVDFACFSFHETKNFSMGEGGAIVINHDELVEKAEIIREKGTNRSKFFRGQVDKYSWVDWGSSYLPSELCTAYLWSQLEVAQNIIDDRLSSWHRYFDGLQDLAQKGRIVLPQIPEHCGHNGHMMFIRVSDLDERTRLIDYLKQNGIGAPYHYVPLHSSAAGEKYCRFHGEDKYTTAESERLLRLPMFYGLRPVEIDYVIEKVYEFFAD
jgi:dTDP-4-amino-4,6-dideoxygalactose transaminase